MALLRKISEERFGLGINLSCEVNYRSGGRLGSNIVAGSLFHNVLDVFDRNHMLPWIVVNERV